MGGMVCSFSKGRTYQNSHYDMTASVETRSGRVKRIFRSTPPPPHTARATTRVRRPSRSIASPIIPNHGIGIHSDHGQKWVTYSHRIAEVRGIEFEGIPACGGLGGLSNRLLHFLSPASCGIFTP